VWPQASPTAHRPGHGRQVREPEGRVHFAHRGADARGLRTRTRVNIQFIEATEIEKHGPGALAGMDAILVPAASASAASRQDPGRALRARARRAYLGICLACSSPSSSSPSRRRARRRAQHGVQPRHAASVIALITECRTRRHRRVAQRGVEPRWHHAPRRAGDPHLARSRAHAVYGADLVRERHRHRYEFNNNYLQKLMNAGLRFSASRATASSKSSSCRSTVLRRQPVPPEFARRRATGIRCSPVHQGGSRPPRGADAVAAAHEALRVRRRARRPFFLIADPASSRARRW